MKARLLVGLLTVALGGLTSCSNILEENGVINNVAESGMGELRINLVADGTLNVGTKSGDTEMTNTITIELPQDEYTNFQITGELQKESGTETTTLGNYSNYTDNKTMLVPVGTYTSIKGNNGEMSNDLGWNCPKFSGTSNTVFTVSKDSETAASTTLNVSLQNSLIQVDETCLSTLKNSVTISELYVYQGTKDQLPPEGTDQKKSLLNEPKKLYVKSGLNNIYIVLKGTVKQNGQKFTSCQQIKDKSGNSTSAKKAYNVQYTLNTDKGSLGLTVNIDGDATIEPINVSVDPYKPDTNTQQQ